MSFLYFVTLCDCMWAFDSNREDIIARPHNGGHRIVDNEQGQWVEMQNNDARVQQVAYMPYERDVGLVRSLPENLNGYRWRAIQLVTGLGRDVSQHVAKYVSMSSWFMLLKIFRVRMLIGSTEKFARELFEYDRNELYKESGLSVDELRQIVSEISFRGGCMDPVNIELGPSLRYVLAGRAPRCARKLLLEIMPNSAIMLRIAKCAIEWNDEELFDMSAVCTAGDWIEVVNTGAMLRRLIPMIPEFDSFPMTYINELRGDAEMHEMLFERFPKYMPRWEYGLRSLAIARVYEKWRPGIFAKACEGEGAYGSHGTAIDIETAIWFQEVYGVMPVCMYFQPETYLWIISNGYKVNTQSVLFYDLPLLKQLHGMGVEFNMELCTDKVRDGLRDDEYEWYMRMCVNGKLRPRYCYGLIDWMQRCRRDLLPSVGDLGELLPYVIRGMNISSGDHSAEIARFIRGDHVIAVRKIAAVHTGRIGLAHVLYAVDHNAIRVLRWLVAEGYCAGHEDMLRGLFTRVGGEYPHIDALALRL